MYPPSIYTTKTSLVPATEPGKAFAENDGIVSKAKTSGFFIVDQQGEYYVPTGLGSIRPDFFLPIFSPYRDYPEGVKCWQKVRYINAISPIEPALTLWGTQ